MKCIPIRLKQARTIAGYTQKGLGIAAGIPESSASASMTQYETGIHMPNFETLKRIGDVLALPIAYFYAEDDELAEVIVKYAHKEVKMKMAKDKDLETIGECINLLDYRYGTGIDDGFLEMSKLIDKIVAGGKAHELANYLTFIIIDIANGRTWRYGQVLAALRASKHLSHAHDGQLITETHIRKLYEQKGLNYDEIHGGDE